MTKLIKPVIILVALVVFSWACSPPPTITICKQTQPAGGAGFPFTAASGSAASPLPPFALNDAQCHTTTLTAGQDHYNTFAENVPAGWILTNISCNATTSAVKIVGANANPAFQLGDNKVTIDLNEPNVTCTFVNRLAPSCCAFSLSLNTGQGSGTVDPSWAVNGGSAYITPPVSAWTVSMPPAKWIQPVASPTPASNVPASPPHYKYKISFNVPPCGMGHVVLAGTFAADNNATAKLDNNAIATCLNCFNTAAVPFNVPVPLPGLHTLEIDVNNLGGNLGSYSGLIVNARVRRICP